MFNWLGNLFPYSDLHSLNLDWILSKMKETAAQAAKAIADSANALAQVIEAKTAAQNAQTAAENAQTAANNAQTAANNAADSAENAVNVAQQAKSAAQTAQNTANTAQSAAQTAQSAAQTAQSVAQTAQSAAQNAQSTAETAQSTAETAQSTAETINGKFPIKGADIANKTISDVKLVKNSFAITTIANESGVVYLPSAQGADISRITDVLTGSGISNFINSTAGTYLQFSIDIYTGSVSNANKNLTVHFPPAYYYRTQDLPLCIPFLFMNITDNKVIRGYAKFLHQDGDYTFQMFFDETPVFPDNTLFVGRIRNIGAYMNTHY